jgi:hypothetical protein
MPPPAAPARRPKIKQLATFSDNDDVSLKLARPAGGASHDDRPRRRSNEMSPVETAALLIGALSILTGIIHAGIAANDFQLAPAYTPPIAMIAAFQIGWGALVVRRPSHGALISGVAANALIVAVWIVSRTFGVPIGPQPWVPEPVGVVDLIAAVAGAVVALAASCIALSGRSSAARRVIPNLAPLLLGVMFICLLYGIGGGGHIGGKGAVWLCG